MVKVRNSSEVNVDFKLALSACDGEPYTIKDILRSMLKIKKIAI